MSLLLLFNQIPASSAQAGTRARFYLVTEPSRLWGDFVVLPCQLTYESRSVMLLLGYFDEDMDEVVIRAAPPPASWNGTVNEARRLLREHDLIQWWWLFDSFLAARGADDAQDFRYL